MSWANPGCGCANLGTVMAFDNPLAEDIWAGKYRFNPGEAGGQADASIEETWARVARRTNGGPA